MTRTTLALALALSTGCAKDYVALSERDGATPPGSDAGSIDWPDPSDPGCTLPLAAFCETFDAPSPGGRGGDLDETVWSVSRYTNGINPTQGMSVLFHPSTALVCGERRTGVLAPDDYVICNDASGTHLTMTMDDGGGTVVSSFRPRQPFDFTGRTGVIAFDLGGRVVGGHGHWPEIMITSEPSPAPYQDLPGLAPFPRHGIGIELAGQVNCTDNPVGPYAFNRVSTIKVLRDYEVISYGPAEYGETECFEVSDERMNHYELRIDQDSVELWVSDPGETTLRRHVVMTGLDLPFSTGYVHFQQAHYNSCKDDTSICDMAHTFNWDNIGFDGPVLPRDRGYDVGDALVPWDHGDSVGQINLGYVLDMDGRSFDIAGVDPAGATSASINFNAWDFGMGSLLGFQLNGGAWQSFESPVSSDETQGGQGSFHAPFDVGLLRPGNNTLALRGDGIVVVNVDVTVR